MSLINEFWEDFKGDEQLSEFPENTLLNCHRAFVAGVEFAQSIVEDYDGNVVDKIFNKLDKEIGGVVYEGD